MDLRVGLSLYLLGAFSLIVLALIFDAPHIFLAGLIVALIAGLSYPWWKAIQHDREPQRKESSVLTEEKTKKQRGHKLVAC